MVNTCLQHAQQQVEALNFSHKTVMGPKAPKLKGPTAAAIRREASKVKHQKSADDRRRKDGEAQMTMAEESEGTKVTHYTQDHVPEVEWMPPSPSKRQRLVSATALMGGSTSGSTIVENDGDPA
ncbi:hypothetical protein Moror_11266 [Moniliophthora roreri MCA 2997]|uniref:Uncharacterized protein n=1 Tax=Moniliophthora roreri (strain MCA 2997) TaxID=1381753 RepID=V2WLW2_MONRO|nr:hypothetical protein Moror_11266 [Moniliophthora roreri MCA 2997]